MNQNPINLPTVQTLRAVTKNQQKAWLAMAAATLVSAASLSASVYVSTIGNTPEPLGSAAVGTGNWPGFNFSTDGDAYFLDAIVVHLNITSPDPSGWNLYGRLYEADANGLPTSLITDVSFTQSALVTGQQLVTFTPTSTFELAANSSYTFALTPEDAEVALVWRLTPSATGFHTDVPTSDWQMPPVLAFSGNQGASWVDLGGGAYRLIAEVQATPVPEPSTWAFMLASATGLFWRQRRRQG